MAKFMRIWFAFLISAFIYPLLLSPLAQASEQYIDQKLSLDFRDADIRNILKLVAEAAGLNIVVGDEVKGRVTIKLVDVSWNQGFEVILQSQSLGMVRIGNVIRITTNEKLRKEEETQLASKRVIGKIEALRIEIIRLKYATAKEMIPIVRMLLSERGSVIADERTNALVIKDIPENIEAIKGLFR